ncbi:MAG: OmpA family protein [Acidobacteria bacterium]|nr:OmpA family protein [Acidobacteriota bacterium]
MKAAAQPIIVVRRKKAAHKHHGGAWKVAYADFVTAMMAFFLVMWLAAQDSRIRSAVAGYFQQPGLLPHEQSNGIMESGRGGIDAQGAGVLQRMPSGTVEAEQAALTSAAEHIRTVLGTGEFTALREQIELSVTAEGLRIELVERNGSSFFDSGSAVLRGESVRILSIIAHEIGGLPNDVVIEGHTDSAPYTRGEKYGNWELSADRANAARRVMETQGLHAGQTKAVRGFADTDLRFKDQPLDARNRRVSIVVRSQVAAALETAVREGQTPAPPPVKERTVFDPPASAGR